MNAVMEKEIPGTLWSLNNYGDSPSEQYYPTKLVPTDFENHYKFNLDNNSTSRDIKLHTNLEMSEDEALRYVERGYGIYGKYLNQVYVVEDQEDPDFVNVVYDREMVRFDRIRRITGYLVGTLDRFNNAKRAEESDRVKHSVRH